MVGLSLVVVLITTTLSGDVYTASEAKQVQNVSYGTIVNVRPVQISGRDDSNVIGAIGGAVLGLVSWGILLVAEPGVLWLLQQALLQVA
ncbi:outer membrane lipoprotein [Escherichia coli]|nr:outer membrane lipoprotein [Escherichia coli]